MNKQKAILAAGCFWGVEELLREMPGVIETQVGYCGGKSAEEAIYNKVKLGHTGHAEAVQITFDADVLSYENLIRAFFKLHDPTTLNQQGNDKGTQYRSAIFYHNDEQKKVAEEVIAKVEKSKKWPKPIVTQVVPATKFYPAEEYHQDYLKKNPGGYTCHWVRD